MVQRRNLSIGITVNLNNYENLRLEVNGELGEDQSAEDLITYLDDILSRLGRGTPETAERVDSYRKRVFSLAGGKKLFPVTSAEVPPAPEASTPVLTKSEPPLAVPTALLPSSPLAVEKKAPPPELVSPTPKAGISPPIRPVVPSSTREKEMPSIAAKKEVPPQVPPVRKKEISPPVSPITQQVPSEASPTAPAPAEPGVQKQEVFSCERCGEPITPVQRKLSRLFQNKDLCKKCLQQP